MIAVACMLLVAGIGYLDFVSGFENSMLIFYLAPIALATWILGLEFGVVISALSVVAAAVADIVGGLPHVALWNDATSFFAYVIFVILLQRLHSLLTEMHKHVAERTSQLQRELARRQHLEKDLALVAEQERSRVGRELHDSLGQHLTGTGLLAQAVVNQLEDSNRAAHQTAQKVVRLIDQGIELAREIARGLYSFELDGDGLFAALNSLARSISSQGAQCEFRHNGSRPTSKALATHLYWVAREASVNAVKHGRPKHVEIRLLTTEDHIQLEIENDGARVLDVVDDSHGIGLKIMTQRARLVGGTLEVERLEQGMIVRCHVPTTAENE